MELPGRIEVLPPSDGAFPVLLLQTDLRQTGGRRSEEDIGREQGGSWNAGAAHANSSKDVTGGLTNALPIVPDWSLGYRDYSVEFSRADGAAAVELGAGDTVGQQMGKWWSVLVWAMLMCVILLIIRRYVKEDELAGYGRAYLFHAVNAAFSGFCLIYAAAVVCAGIVVLVWVESLNLRLEREPMALQATGLFALLRKCVISFVLHIFSMIIALFYCLMIMVPSTWVAEMDLGLYAWLEGERRQGRAAEGLLPRHLGLTQSADPISAGTKVFKAVWSFMSKGSSWRSLLYCLLLKWPFALMSATMVISLNLMSLAFIAAPVVYVLSPGGWSHLSVYGVPLLWADSLWRSYRTMCAGLILAPLAVAATKLLARAAAAMASLAVI